MTLIANTPASREEALRFPFTSVVCAASRLEKALIGYFKGRRPGFWDMEVVVNTLSPESPRIWREYADRVRASAPPTPQWLPAGRRTDRQLKPAAWMGMPLRGGGFGAAILVAKPDLHQRIFSDAVVMAMRRRWTHWPSLEEVTKLVPEDGALVTQTSMICVRDGRWRVLGQHDGFDSNRWVWPTPWRRNFHSRREGDICLNTASGESMNLRIAPATLRLDPGAGRRCAGMSSPALIESEVPKIMAGTHSGQTDLSDLEKGIVTPERLAAWRKINAALQQGIKS